MTERIPRDNFDLARKRAERVHDEFKRIEAIPKISQSAMRSLWFGPLDLSGVKFVYRDEDGNKVDL